ncbi:unnamed protein product [Brassica oleracea var. botrytis]
MSSFNLLLSRSGTLATVGSSRALSLALSIGFLHFCFRHPCLVTVGTDPVLLRGST